MKLARLGEFRRERPAVIDSDFVAIDVSSIVDDFDDRFFAEGGVEQLRAADLSGLPRRMLNDTDRLGAPVSRPSKVVCIGLNYRLHAAESQSEVPLEPIVFFKSPGSLCGPNEAIPMPPQATKLDWEVELALVIGREARYLRNETEALSCVAGYSITNDVSERSFQLERGGQWVKGKSAENFNPLGPWLVTTDELASGPQCLGLRLSVNGVEQQDGNTSDMIFSVAYIVWYLSQFMVLEPGDVINTGTPAGVALGKQDPNWLQLGDVLDLSIDRLGTQRQIVVPTVLSEQ